MEGNQLMTSVKISEGKRISKSELLMLLKTYNCYQEGKSFQLRHRECSNTCMSLNKYDVEMPALDWGEHSTKSYNTRLKSNRFVSMSLAFGALLLPQVNEEDGAELIIEGLLNISWGLRRPIRLQMHDDNERMCFSGSKLLRVGQQTGLYKKGPMPQTLTNSSETENESTNTDDFPQNMSSSSIAECDTDNCEDEVPQLMRTKSDASSLIQQRTKYRTSGENQRIKRHRFSINGHFYNHKTSVFTPAYGSVTNVRVNSSMNTSQVLNLLLNKFRVENTADEFALYVVHESGERTKLKDSEYPLISRILHGPCEKIARIFLMEKDLGEEITYDVAQYIKFEMPVLDSFVEKLKEEEEREINKLTTKYSALRSMIHQQLEDLTETEDTI